MIDQNDLAVRISQREGKKEEVNIAQIKEVMRLMFEVLADCRPSQVLELIESHKKGYGQ